ncbi:hypothetical protein B0H11DRAFT_2051658 [Mycena galericulata]|nr:hypothetical protein B0H11DRAFT_2051658 [Mycena galericulata]
MSGARSSGCLMSSLLVAAARFFGVDPFLICSRVLANSSMSLWADMEACFFFDFLSLAESIEEPEVDNVAIVFVRSPIFF